MQTYQHFNSAPLNEAGLNRQAIFDLATLPADILATLKKSCASLNQYTQLLLIGHAGKRLWEAVQAANILSADPIDDFTVQTTKRWFAQCLASHPYDIIYPTTATAIGLQRLGQLAGWHHATPFKVGIDHEWGTWFAYRAVVLTNTQFEPSRPVQTPSPCEACQTKPCISHCPPGALAGGQFDFEKCIGYRKQSDSRCKNTCLARLSCPVGEVHRYSDAQIHHSYSRSMRAIEKYY